MHGSAAAFTLVFWCLAAGCASEQPSPAGSDDVGRFDAGSPASPVREDAAKPVPPTEQDAARDAGRPPREAGTAVTGAESCGLGAISNSATQQQLDVFGSVVYYVDGQSLPPGRYRVQYTGGCFKFNFLFAWSVQGGDATRDGWFLVGDSPSERVLKLPGTGLSGTSTASGFSSFQDCVDANLALPAAEFDFAGGKLGVWLEDSPYVDNVVGEGGANPAWKLTLLTECPPDLVLL